MTSSISNPGPRELVPPDYDHSILSLLASIELAGGSVGVGHTPLAALPPTALGSARNIVLLIIDGLGCEYLERVSPQGPLTRQLLSRLHTVFPATTAAAITSFFTGTAPARHGLVGWFTHLETTSQVVLPLLGRVRNGAALQAPALASLYRAAPLTTRLGRDCHVVTARRIAGSAYTRFHAARSKVHGYRSLGSLFGQLERLVRADGPPRYVHAYWPELDHLAHEHGVRHQRVREHLRQLEAALEQFLRRIAGSGTTLLVTADHGFIDTAAERTLLLNDHPALYAGLRLPLSGESRLSFVHTEPEQRQRVQEGLSALLGEHGTVTSGERFIRDGFFGPGEKHPALAARVGDWVVALADGWTLRDRLPGERPFWPVGVHGGLTAAERDVPLCVFEA